MNLLALQIDRTSALLTVLAAAQSLENPLEKCVFSVYGPCWEARFRIMCYIAYTLEDLLPLSPRFWHHFLKKRSPPVEVTSHNYV